MTAITLFASTYILVLALGLQSRFVNHNQVAMAFCNSFLISGGQLILYKLGPNATGWEIAAYMLGGPFGIVTSIHLHNHFFIGVKPTQSAKPITNRNPRSSGSVKKARKSKHRNRRPGRHYQQHLLA